MQAQWPSAPYVGIWTRTTSFKRVALERELARSDRRQGDRHAADAPSGHAARLRASARGAQRDELPVGVGSAAKRLARLDARARRGRAGDDAGGARSLERGHGLTGIDARRAWQAARVRAHVLHHHETALWSGRPEGRFVAIEEPEGHVPVEARAEILRRYLAAFGPASRRDIVAWSMMHVPELSQRSIGSSRCAASGTSRAVSFSTFRGRRSRRRRTRAGPVLAEVGQPAACVRRPNARAS